MINLDKYRKSSRGLKVELYAQGLFNTASGDGRAVFPLSEETVIKIAHNKKRWCLPQNLMEIQKSPLLDGEYITKVLDASDDGTWLVAERAKGFEEDVDVFLKKECGTHAKGDLIAAYIISLNPVLELYKDTSIKIYKKCKKSSWFNGLVKTLGTAGYKIPDMQSCNFMWKNDKVVMVDYGIDYTPKEAKSCVWFKS